MKKNFVICFVDTERAPPLGWFWEDNKPTYNHYGQIIEHGFFTSFQWQFEGQSKPKIISVIDDMERFEKNPKDDFIVAEKAAQIVDMCDIIIAHNGKRFDWKHLKTKWIFHGITPPRKPMIIDTLQEAKTAAHHSNSLANLADFYGLTEKPKNEAEMADMIYGTIKNRAKAIRKQNKYAIQDLQPLIDYFYKIKPYIERFPSASMLSDNKLCCPYCEGKDYYHRGENYLATIKAMKKWYSCKDCGRKFAGEIVKRAKY